MSDIFAKVDEFAASKLIGNDEGLSQCIANSVRNGLPNIKVSAVQGKFLMMQALLAKSKRILEIGTLGGYSTIWLAKALNEDGEIITCEYNDKFAQVARQSIDNANVKPKVDIRVGKALDTLSTLDGTFDFVFIDADKNNSPNYLIEAIRLSNPGAIIVIDNTVQHPHSFLDPHCDYEGIVGNRKVYDLLSKLQKEDKVIATHSQHVNEKGSDAYCIAIRT